MPFLLVAPLQAQQGARAGVRRLAPDARLWNTGLAVRFGPTGIAAGSFAHLVDESDQQVDGNGDGDLADRILHVVDPDARTVVAVPRAWTLTGFATRASFGEHFALAVSEAGQGSDLTGDGDLADAALSVVDARTGVVRDLGLAVESFLGARNVLSVRSPFGGFDTNGALAVYDAERDRLISLGLIGDGRIAASGLAIQLVSERFTAVDLNGDGDQSDTVVGVYDAAQDVLANTGLAVVPSSGTDPVAVQRNTLLVPVAEAAQSVDLNGDGDRSDEILHEYELTTGTRRNTGFDGQSMVPGDLLGRGPEAAVYFIVRESGRDQNGDGDASDLLWFSRTSDGTLALFPGPLGDFLEFDANHFGARFVVGFLDPTTHVLDVERDVAQDLKLPTFIDLPVLASPLLVAATAAEELMGEDVDGDGLQTSHILHVHDLQRGTTDTIGRGADIDFALAFFPRIGIDGGLVAFASRELPGGPGNGDGDTSDSVVVLYRSDPARGGRARWIETHASIRARRPGESVFFPRVGDPWVVWPILESDESKDLHPDGALDDELLAVYHAPTGRLAFFAGAALNLLEHGRLALTLAESFHGDLNGDGDALDSVLHFVEQL